MIAEPMRKDVSSFYTIKSSILMKASSSSMRVVSFISELHKKNIDHFFSQMDHLIKLMLQGVLQVKKCQIKLAPLVIQVDHFG